jgi:tripartite ATP-independent transporter DctP family solute receptor
MKKYFILLSVLLVVLFVSLFFLIKSSNTKEVNDLPVHADTIELSFAHHMPTNTLLHKAAERFAVQISKKTNNKVNIKIYPNQELGNSYELLELSRLGKIDIIVTPTAKITAALPSMQYSDLPFLFPTKEDVYALLDGKVGSMLLKELSKIDLLGVAFWGSNYKDFLSSKPLKKLEDFKDLKIRAMKSRVIMEQFIALDAKPININFYANKEAIEDGVIDAGEYSLGAISSMGFYKKFNNLTLSKHAYLTKVMTFNKKCISKLPLDIQNILITTAKEVALWEREESQKVQESLISNIKDNGVNIHTLSQAENEKIKAKTEYILKKYEHVIGSHLISKTQEYMYKKYNKQDVVVIGIDVDLSMGAKGSGLAIKRGVELAVDKLNKEGGLLGKKVLVIAKDHQGISKQANENIKEFIEDKNTIAVVGGKHSAIISSYMKQIQENKLLFFSPWAAAPSVTENGYKDNYIFRVSLNDRYATKFLAKEALKMSKKPALIVENSLWGKQALKNINLYLESQGFPKQNGIIINRGEDDFEKYFFDLKVKDYDSVIMVLNSQESQKIIEQMWQHAINLPVISHWGLVGDAFFKANKKYLKDIDLRFIQTFSLNHNLSSEAQDLAKNYLKTYSKESYSEINAITGVVQAYDATMLLANAIKKANSFKSTEIKTALENLGIYNGVLKTYKKPFNTTDHDALKLEDFFMAKFSKDGNIIPIVE